MTALIENEHVTLIYEEENALIYDVYKVNIDFETIQSSLNAGVKVMKKTHANKWLTDTRAIGGFNEDGAQWVLEEWAPHAMKAGWEYWALLVPEDMEGRAVMVQFVQAFANLGVHVRVFVDMDEAREWLTSV